MPPNAPSRSNDYGVVEDGFGGEWLRCREDCGLEVVRPGKVQCECDYQDEHGNCTHPLVEWGPFRKWCRRCGKDLA